MEMARPEAYYGMETKRVLLVEDNADNRPDYATILRHHGFEASEAVDGATAVEPARQRPPDAILMDISLPILDGGRATEMIKADPATSRIPVIALTAHALTQDQERARKVGCDDYLTKPCEPARVVAALNRAIEA